MAAKRATHARPIRGGKDFPEALSLAYCRLSLLAPTIVIGDLNAAPTDDDRTDPPTATDMAVRDAMNPLGLTDLPAGPTGAPSHYPHQAGNHPPGINASTRQPTGTSCRRARAADPSISTSSSPTYPNPQPRIWDSLKVIVPEYSCRVTLRTANWEVSFENVARIDFTWFSYCQNTP